MSEKILTIRLLEEKYGVCRLNNNESIPGWIKNSDFLSITKTFDELSIVCLEKDIPNEVKCEKEWRILKVEGQLDFSLVGILSSISTILAKSGISIFAISTYDTDYILVKEKDVDNAMKALIKNKYEVIV
ncbi:ACT domain-containing protein [Clostridium beijerinckii]|uniref:ACT domain-containing protein n=1 Tax=Clostridium beijerinckii TaxID=1520 RepID=A0A1S8REJ0_CLOBE|nr:ACT domain-containing protein [Clostridium beijerinckii]NMF06829.1 ACT domain-containing protein [Clostridium beijerinckii]NRY58972.1 hypothetical protein [Clostridium beijerinckii]OOM51624.1 hypothetical protein CLBCK_50000 [Clostridium beijerinckii]